MGDFDAELYLRAVGEELLLQADSGQRRPWGPPLLEQAQALVAVGAITPARARAAIDDYSLALAARSGNDHHMQAFSLGERRSHTRPAPELPARRIAHCDQTIVDARGTLDVRYVVFTETSTEIAIRWRPPSTAQPPRGGRLRALGAHHGPPQVQVADDRGTTAMGGFGGGGSDQEWTGRFSCQPPLAGDTAWITIDGTRVELSAEAVASETLIEQLPDAHPAHRYLWQRLAVHEFPGPPDLEAPIDALLAAGALAADDPELAAIREVRAALPRHPGMPPGSSPGSAVPDPWRSLLARHGRSDGPQGHIALDAVAPSIDGYAVAVNSLDSAADGFSVDVEIVPGTWSIDNFAWWAVDDRGNHHLGRNSRWSNSDERSEGVIEYWPALHPGARTLALMPTGPTSRAVIAIPLSWADPPETA